MTTRAEEQRRRRARVRVRRVIGSAAVELESLELAAAYDERHPREETAGDGQIGARHLFDSRMLGGRRR